MGNWKKLKGAVLENNVNIQKQPLEVFYKRSCFQKFCNIYRKTPVVESLFSKVVPKQIFSREYCKIFKNTYFEEHL